MRGSTRIGLIQDSAQEEEYPAMAIGGIPAFLEAAGDGTAQQCSPSAPHSVLIESHYSPNTMVGGGWGVTYQSFDCACHGEGVVHCTGRFKGGYYPL